MIESTKDLSLSEERQRSPTKPSATAESEETAATAEASVSKPTSSGVQDNNPELVALNPKKVIECFPSARGLGWVDFNFECSTVCLILPGLMGIWQKRLGSWAKWWNAQIKVNPT